ncbi:hypothetical protein A2U01_0071726, partial [Trifolium medium]|nr:hypothetical protein [Trifolium medium]
MHQACIILKHASSMHQACIKHESSSSSLLYSSHELHLAQALAPLLTSH